MHQWKLLAAEKNKQMEERTEIGQGRNFPADINSEKACSRQLLGNHPPASASMCARIKTLRPSGTAATTATGTLSENIVMLIRWLPIGNATNVQLQQSAAFADQDCQRIGG